MKKQIIINTDKCTGCKSCELACSYHHVKKFSPIYSSIKILKDDITDKISIVKYEQNNNALIKCDNCITESFPLCVKFCFSNALDLQEME
jgi:Fe-S-cluster-containing hydrogenase component 2